MNKISSLKKHFRKDNQVTKSVLSSLIKVSAFIDSVIEDVNKLPDGEQRSNYLNKFKRNMFMIDEFWYKDLSEEEKLQFQNVLIRY